MCVCVWFELCPSVWVLFEFVNEINLNSNGREKDDEKLKLTDESEFNF